MEPNVKNFKKLSTPILELSDDFELNYESEKSLKFKLKCLERKLLEKDEIIKQYELKIKERDGKLSQVEEVARTAEIYKNRLNNSIREIDGIRVEFSNYIKILADVKKEKTSIENELCGYKLYYNHTKTMLEDLEKKFEDSQVEYESKIEKLNEHIKSFQMKFTENVSSTQNGNKLKSKSTFCINDSVKEHKMKMSEVRMHSSRQSMKFSSNLDIVHEVAKEEKQIDSMSEMKNTKEIKKSNSNVKLQCEETQQISELNTKLDSIQLEESAAKSKKKKMKSQKEKVEKLSTQEKFKRNFTKLLSFHPHH